jgi:hypothetical protein
MKFIAASKLKSGIEVKLITEFKVCAGLINETRIVLYFNITDTIIVHNK